LRSARRGIKIFFALLKKGFRMSAAAQSLRQRFLPEGRPIAAPSLLSADFSSLRDVMRALWNARSPWLHLDVMDGHFVPNITFGPPLIKSLRGAAGEGVFFDAHLMIEEPLRYAEPFAASGCDLITFHLEAKDDPRAVIEKLRALKKRVGISIKPATSAERLEDLLPLVDLVLVMTVEPGFGGQRLLPDCLKKVASLAQRRAERGLHFLLEVDGGIDPKTALSAVQAGAEVLVAGSAVFGEGTGAVERNIQLLRGAMAG
jgi:ribulose-phosphate 3-epimerase